METIKTENKVCVYCKQEFTPTMKRAKFCSTKCYRLYHNTFQNERKTNLKLTRDIRFYYPDVNPITGY